MPERQKDVGYLIICMEVNNVVRRREYKKKKKGMEIMEIGENQLDGIVDQSERYIYKVPTRQLVCSTMVMFRQWIVLTVEEITGS